MFVHEHNYGGILADFFEYEGFLLFQLLLRAEPKKGGRGALWCGAGYLL